MKIGWAWLNIYYGELVMTKSKNCNIIKININGQNIELSNFTKAAALIDSVGINGIPPEYRKEVLKIRTHNGQKRWKRRYIAHKCVYDKMFCKEMLDFNILTLPQDNELYLLGYKKDGYEVERPERFKIQRRWCDRHTVADALDWLYPEENGKYNQIVEDYILNEILPNIKTEDDAIDFAIEYNLDEIPYQYLKNFRKIQCEDGLNILDKIKELKDYGVSHFTLEHFKEVHDEKTTEYIYKENKKFKQIYENFKMINKIEQNSEQEMRFVLIGERDSGNLDIIGCKIFATHEQIKNGEYYKILNDQAKLNDFNIGEDCF
ncbi:MAG: hypothetical protein ACOCWG_05565, partial [bacterium]